MAKADPIRVELDPATPLESAEKLCLHEQVVESLGLALIVCDKNQIIQLLNHKAEELLNHSKDQMVGKYLTSFLHKNEILSKSLTTAINQNTAVSEQDLLIEGPNFKKQIVSIEVSPDTTNAKNSDLITILIKVKPDHQRISNDLITKGKTKSIESMSAVLAHEIKNPLSGIRGAAQLLGQRAVEKDQKLTSLIANECDRILYLIDQMQTFSDPELVEPEHYNIHEALVHVVDLAKQGFAADIVVEQHFDPSLPYIMGSKNQMIQALLNLLKNAAEAVPEQGGRIQISTAWRRDMRFKVSTTSDPVFLPIEIKVQDNGPGISEDMASCLFDPFVTNKVNGTGLGLALVKRFVANHGGVISALNTDTQGACFQILLPPTTESHKIVNEQE